MIRMLPEHIANNVKSQAEIKLFKEFKDHQTAQKCIILHSLGISEHINNVFGEIDFVVICANGVLCIEVKGGIVRCNNGIWEFVNRYGKKDNNSKGPFQQVQGNMHSLRQYLLKRLGDNDPLVTCQYASCVIMPDCQFSYRGIEIIPEILFDKTRYTGLDEIVSESFVYWQNRLKEKHGFSGCGLSEKEMDRLADLLRGDFCFVPSMQESINETTAALCALTDEQYVVLESLEDNERTLVSGMAGTGKTLLAMEQARRWSLAGHKVKYVCFNKNISDYVKSRFESEGLTIDVSTLHSAMLQGGYPHSDGHEYFEQILPAQFMKSKLKCVFDYLIVDEGQDLFRENYLPCLGKMINGGLKNGKWLMFYDQNQNMYNDNNQLNVCREQLKECGAASFKLSVNCRNTKQIAEANVLMTGIGGMGKPKVSGMKVQYLSYKDKIEEHQILDEILITLRNEGVYGEDLIILSKYSIDNKCNCLFNNAVAKNAGKMKISGQIWNAKDSEVRFSTIAAFKGLEAKVVILIDVDDFLNPEMRILNYVAASRAISLLYVIYDKEKEKDRQAMLANNYVKIL